MNLDSQLRTEIQKAVSSLFYVQVEQLQIQPTNAEFEGSHTLVCFPLVKIFLLIILMSCTVRLSAQERRTVFGVKLGANWAGFSENSASFERNGSFRLGLNAGVFIRKEISKYFSFQPELYYSLQGQKSHYFYFTNEETSVTLHYLNAPLLLNINRINIFGFRKIGLQLGPQVGYLLSGDEPFSRSYHTDFSKFDFSICGGATCTITEQITIGARYNYGLTDVNYLPAMLFTSFSFYGQNATPLDYGPTKVYNRVAQVFIEYTF